MSTEVINWALNTAPIPRDRRDASSLAMMLVGLANRADPDGRNAFPSLARLARYTRSSERPVRYALRALEELDLIRPSDPAIVAAYVKRADRRPNGYNLAIHLVDKSDDGRQSLPPVEQDEGQIVPKRGANSDLTGGKACPRTSLTVKGTVPRASARLRRARRSHQLAASATPATRIRSWLVWCGSM